MRHRITRRESVMQINSQSKEAIKRIQQEQIKDIRESVTSPPKVVTAIAIAYVTLFLFALKDCWITIPQCVILLPFIFVFCVSASRVFNSNSFTKLRVLESVFLSFMISAVQHLCIALVLAVRISSESQNSYELIKPLSIAGLFFTISIVGLFEIKKKQAQ